MLLISLGAEVSSSVLQQLTPEEIERLTAEIVTLKRIDMKLRDQVIDEMPAGTRRQRRGWRR